MMNRSDEASLLSGACAGLAVALLFWGGLVPTAAACVCLVLSGVLLSASGDE